MKFRFLTACVLAACACGLGATAAARPWSPAAQEAKPAEVKVSEAERKAGDKIDKAKGAEAKIQAAAEFLKKFPQSSLRPTVAQVVAAEVANTADPQLKISLAETYLSLFTAPGEADRMNALLLDAYISSERPEESFRAAGPWLQQHPDDVDVMRRLATIALNASIRGNNTFLAQGRQYGLKALELLEADKRPAEFEAAQWPEYRTKWVPALHREVGVIAFRTGDRAAAKTHLEKAAELKHPDPAVYLILSDMANEEYDTLAKQYTVAAAGEKDAALKRAQASLDRVIELYAQTLAMTEGNAQYEPARAQLRQDLEKYYKFRNNGSTDGLQQLIDKHKKP
jgi:hypothetical protein